MQFEIESHLSEIRQRQHHAIILQWVTTGLFVGSLIGILIACARFVGGSESPWPPLCSAIMGLTIGAIQGWWRRPGFKEAAQKVDSHYRLKDQAVSAWQFSQQPPVTDPIRQLQIRNATLQLQKADAKRVCPLTPPTNWLYAAATFLSVLGLVSLPLAAPTTANEKKLDHSAHITHEADVLEESLLQEIEDLRERNPESQALNDLAADIEQMIQQMKIPGIDERDALATLSQMQSRVSEAQAEFNMDIVDAQLKNLGEAMQATREFKPTAETLKTGDYDTAANQLEEMDFDQLTDQEQQALAERLAAVAKNMDEAGLQKLADSAAEMAAGLRDKNSAKQASGAQNVADELREASVRQSTHASLSSQLSKLGESKSNCVSNGGDDISESKSSKKTFGHGITDKPLGDKASKIETERTQEKITGTLGADGESERESMRSTESADKVTREYRETYQEYRKMSEEVLQRESLPLGHRQTIRRYFEAIRPTSTPQP